MPGELPLNESGRIGHEYANQTILNAGVPVASQPVGVHFALYPALLNLSCLVQRQRTSIPLCSELSNMQLRLATRILLDALHARPQNMDALLLDYGNCFPSRLS